MHSRTVETVIKVRVRVYISLGTFLAIVVDKTINKMMEQLNEY